LDRRWRVAGFFGQPAVVGKGTEHDLLDGFVGLGVGNGERVVGRFFVHFVVAAEVLSHHGAAGTGCFNGCL